MEDNRRFQLGELGLAARWWTHGAPGRPPVVLLHGTGDTAEGWAEVAGPLCRDREVVAVDLRGHGASDWPGRYTIDLMAGDVRALLDLLGRPVVDLVGHSLGGLVACRVVGRDARSVRRLVLEDVALPSPREPSAPARPPGVLAFDWGVVEQVRPEIDAPASHWSATMAAIEVPTLVVSGGAASFLPPDRVDALVATLPQGSKVVIEAGHEVHAAAPRPFLDALRAFLDRGVTPAARV